MMKKLIALVLCAVLVLSMMPVNAASAADNFTIRVTNATVTAGNEFNVDLVLENNPGFSAMILTVSYDETYLTLNGVKNKAVGDDLYMSVGKNILWDGSKNYTENGTLATLSFTVKDTTPTTAPLTITVKVREVIDIDGNNLTAQAKNGTITVNCAHKNLEKIPGKDATCTENGLTEGKKCASCGTVTVEQKPIEKLGHKEEVIKGKAATCTETGLTDGKKCATCGTVTVKQETIPANGHKWVDATCTAPKTCVVCDVTEGTKLGHNYSSEWSKNETNHYHACSRCDSKVDTAAHTYKDDKDETCEICGYERGHIHSLTKVGAVAATCTESGNKEYYTCSGCDVWFEDAAGKTAITDKNSVVIKAAGHTYDKATWTWDGTTAASVSVACSVCDNKATTKATVTSEVTTAATCTADGVRTYTATATVGGKTFTDTKTEAIEATGHNFKNGKCTVCGAADPDYVAPTEPTEPPVTEPPVTEPPVTEPPVTEPPVTEPPVTEPPVTEPPHTHSFGAWVTVKDPSSKEVGKEERTCACGEKETREIPKLSNPFKDVNNKNYYYEPVLWAVNKGITAGTEKDSFGPNDPCTRAQIVTFLWRAAGSPEPKADAKNPFTDVKTTDYYYKAVLWAVEKGITSGVSATKFGSGAVCTRAQVVTFLWRAAGSPAAKGTNPFTDVKTTDYYCQAVLWAVEKGITAGTSATTFGSNENCVRGQIVTFLYKAYAK